MKAHRQARQVCLSFNDLLIELRLSQQVYVFELLRAVDPLSRRVARSQLA